MHEFAHEQLLDHHVDQRRGPALQVLVAPEAVATRDARRVRRRATGVHPRAQAVEHVPRHSRLERLATELRVQLEHDVAELELTPDAVAADAGAVALGELPGPRRRRQHRHRRRHRAAPQHPAERVAQLSTAGGLEP